jgi:DNA-cytosine methyltransferase
MAGEREMGELTHFSLFTGIGGIDLSAEWAGFTTVGQCEWADYPTKILEKHWPDVPRWRDIHSVTAEDFYKRTGLRTVDLLSGGFPCQDLSVAGKQEGLGGARSGLWFEMLRIISELRPRWVIAENVRGAVNLALDTVKMGMEGEGYQVWPFVLPASAFGAPHRRERLFVAGCREDVANAISRRWETEWITGMGRTMEEWGNPSNMSPKTKNAGACFKGIMWPTPRASSHTSPCIHGEGGLDIQTTVKLWPTPAAQDGKNSTLPQSQKERDTIPGAVIKQGQEGQLNPDWVECLMGFPIGWTNPEVDEPEPWPGWPAPMGAKMRATPAAWDCQGASGGGQGRSLRTDIYNIKNGLTEVGQFPYEPPRVAKGIKNRADRIKALGNAVVPYQVLSQSDPA